MNLRPSGDSDLAAMAHVVFLDVGTEFRDKMWPFRTRPDQTHLSANHIKKLGQFVETELAQHAAQRGAPGIVLGRPDGVAFGGDAAIHSAELQQSEMLPMPADSFLPE